MPKLKNLRLFDDPVMKTCCQKYPECVRLIARIVLNNPTLDFAEKTYQKHIANPNVVGKSVIMDFYFKDKDGKIYDIEIENANSVILPFYRRARYYSSMMDAEILNKGVSYELLPDSYVIFFCEKDPVGQGLPLYTLKTFISESNEEPVNDGRTIIYVNGEIEDDTALGRLVRDFKCTDPKELCYNEIKEFYREENDMLYAPQMAPHRNPTVQAMFEEVEAKGIAKGIARGKAEGRIETASAMLAEGLSEDIVSKCTSLPVEEVRKLKKV